MPATSGAEALKGVRVQLPDLILLDLMMPEMDGLEVCRRLKADPLTQRSRSFSSPPATRWSTWSKASRSGAVDYVTKPFNRS